MNRLKRAGPPQHRALDRKGSLSARGHALGAAALTWSAPRPVSPTHQSCVQTLPPFGARLRWRATRSVVHRAWRFGHAAMRRASFWCSGSGVLRASSRASRPRALGSGAASSPGSGRSGPRGCAARSLRSGAPANWWTEMFEVPAGLVLGFNPRIEGQCLRNMVLAPTGQLGIGRLPLWQPAAKVAPSLGEVAPVPPGRPQAARGQACSHPSSRRQSPATLRGT